jgi:hypothetical protein
MFTGTNVLHRPAALFKLPVNLLARYLFGRHPALLLRFGGWNQSGRRGGRSQILGTRRWRRAMPADYARSAMKQTYLAAFVCRQHHQSIGFERDDWAGEKWVTRIYPTDTGP